MQGNALGGEGISKLCGGLAGCITLAEVNLMAVGITEQHQESVRLFANVASCHPALQIINLDGNLIGEGLSVVYTDSPGSDIIAKVTVQPTLEHVAAYELFTEVVDQFLISYEHNVLSVSFDSSDLLTIRLGLKHAAGQNLGGKV